MPNLDLVPVDLYQPNDVYNYVIDNRPLEGIVTRIDMLNGQVDNDAQTLRESIGSAGSLSARLNESLNDDGSLKTVAIDNALHSIAAHIDAGGFVRMTTAEQAKLSLIENNANNLRVNFNTISGIIGYSTGTINFAGSSTITWRYQGGNIYADNDFPAEVRHVHYYNVNPVPVNLISPDYINYKTSSIDTPYKSGSLRVYLNGIRLSQNANVEAPIYDGTEYVPTVYSVTEGANIGGIVTGGLFSLSSAITSDDVIFIDFDVVYS